MAIQMRYSILIISYFITTCNGLILSPITRFTARSTETSPLVQAAQILNVPVGGMTFVLKTLC